MNSEVKKKTNIPGFHRGTRAQGDGAGRWARKRRAHGERWGWSGHHHDGWRRCGGWRRGCWIGWHACSLRRAHPANTQNPEVGVFTNQTRNMAKQFILQNIHIQSHQQGITLHSYAKFWFCWTRTVVHTKTKISETSNHMEEHLHGLPACVWKQTHRYVHTEKNRIWQWCVTHLLGGPLETSDNGVLDFIQVLHSLGAVDEHVGSAALGTEAPDLPGLGDVPRVLLGEKTGTCLQLLLGEDVSLVDVLGQAVGHGHGSHEETVVLVWWLGQAHAVGLLRDGFTVRHNGVGFLQRKRSWVREHDNPEN